MCDKKAKKIFESHKKELSELQIEKQAADDALDRVTQGNTLLKDKESTLMDIFKCIKDFNSRSSDSLHQGSDPDEFVSLLPQEIWLKIFHEFSPYELCNIGLTCKSFLALTRDSSLWTEISLVGDANAIASTRSVTQLFNRCSHLVKVSITSCDDISDIILALSKSCRQLKQIVVKYCQPLTYSDLSNLANGCLKLESINFEGTNCLNGDGDSHEMEGSTMCRRGQSLSFSRLFGKFKCLKELNLFLCRNLYSIDLELIAEHCQNLEYLNIDEIEYLTDKSVNFFIEQLGQTIKYLWIDGESLSDKSFSNFHKMVNLELLSISFAVNMGQSGILSIGKLGNLKRLKLRKGEELEPIDFVTTFAMGNLKTLLHLDISWCS